ncbi:MAG: penicillin-binding protein 2, partial [Colwellia sp.]
KPEIVVTVAIENVAKGGGSTNAGPVVRQIMDQYFGDRVITRQTHKAKPIIDSVIKTIAQEAD